MNASEIHQLLTRLTGSYGGQIDPQQLTFIQEDLDAGEWENAASNLAASLAQSRVGVSSQNKSVLRNLLVELDSDTKFVDQLQ